jgi:Na+:H+ antiporter
LAFDIILQILFVLALAVLAGEVFEQFGLPSVAGELLSGTILGPTILGVVTSNSQTEAISSISLFFVVFLIGFEMKTSMVRTQLLPGVLVTTTSFIIPLIFATAFGVLALPFGAQSDAIVALAVSVPSISIISILVMELNLITKRSGQLIIASVTITDIVAFLILSAITQSASVTYSVLEDTGVFVAAFIAVDWLLNSHPEAVQRVIDRGARVTRREDIAFALLLIFGLFTAALLQAIGVSFILGSFFAGLIVHDGLIGKRPFRRISETLARMNRAFFIPLFFGFAGVQTDFGPSYYYLLPLLALMIAVSVIPATGLTYLVGKRVLKKEEDSRNVAFVMGGRGAVGIVIVSVALADGLVSTAAYSFVVLGTLAVSLLIPVLAGRRRLESTA